MIEPEQKLKMEDQEKLEIDKGEEKLLELKWVTLEELKSIDLRPTNIRNMIINKEYLNGLTHIIERDSK